MTLDSKKRNEERIKKFYLTSVIIFLGLFLGLMILVFIVSISILVTPQGRERISQGALNETFIIGMTVGVGIVIVVLSIVFYKLLSLVFSNAPVV